MKTTARQAAGHKEQQDKSCQYVIAEAFTGGEEKAKMEKRKGQGDY